MSHLTSFQGEPFVPVADKFDVSFGPRATQLDGLSHSDGLSRIRRSVKNPLEIRDGGGLKDNTPTSANVR